MIVSIHQPAYLPWLGYFDKIRHCDRFLYLDTVQFQKGSFQNRNKIRAGNQGLWLTLPVQTSGGLEGLTLDKVRLDNTIPWRRKHLATLQQNYAKAPCYETVMAGLHPFYQQEWTLLSDLCFEMMIHFMKQLNLDPGKVVKASELPPVAGHKSELVLDHCRQLGAACYLSGSMGREYLQLEEFQRAGIAVTFQDYAHPQYRQAPPVFLPYMGVVDLLMNEPEPWRVY